MLSLCLYYELGSLLIPKDAAKTLSSYQSLTVTQDPHIVVNHHINIPKMSVDWDSYKWTFTRSYGLGYSLLIYGGPISIIQRLIRQYSFNHQWFSSLAPACLHWKNVHVSGA